MKKIYYSYSIFILFVLIDVLVQSKDTRNKKKKVINDDLN